MIALAIRSRPTNDRTSLLSLAFSVKLVDRIMLGGAFSRYTEGLPRK